MTYRDFIVEFDTAYPNTLSEEKKLAIIKEMERVLFGENEERRSTDQVLAPEFVALYRLCLVSGFYLEVGDLTNFNLVKDTYHIERIKAASVRLASSRPNSKKMRAGERY